ncbi:Hypothetical protein AA314_09592 [Archangium gephyra]|uniref:Uncharacterized protein n=1 Tax=Archangium gephyra TaxID=48 RepID=A0AAC8TKD3_9BACT|nr:Hypothetical protein AA314_09592 [Archangium gephyra]
MGRGDRPPLQEQLADPLSGHDRPPLAPPPGPSSRRRSATHTVRPPPDQPSCRCPIAKFP